MKIPSRTKNVKLLQSKPCMYIYFIYANSSTCLKLTFHNDQRQSEQRWLNPLCASLDLSPLVLSQQTHKLYSESCPEQSQIPGKVPYQLRETGDIFKTCIRVDIKSSHWIFIFVSEGSLWLFWRIILDFFSWNIIKKRSLCKKIFFIRAKIDLKNRKMVKSRPYQYHRKNPISITLYDMKTVKMERKRFYLLA